MPPAVLSNAKGLRPMTLRASCLIQLLMVTVGCGGEPVQIVHAAPGAAQAGESPVYAAADVPWWRGVRQNGIYEVSEVPLRWSPSENVIWKAAVPGRGHSTPCVWGPYVFVTTADEQAQTKTLLCFDRATGEKRWEHVLYEGAFMHVHKKNSQAPATPACDGTRVIVPIMADDGIWVSAVDFDGNQLWKVKAGPYKSEHGYGSSPVFYQSLVIISGDNPGSAFIAALHRATGNVVWRIERPSGGNYATPVVATIAGKPQLVVHGRDLVTSYNPATGEQLWQCDGPCTVAACTVAWDDNHVFASGGYPQKEIICVKADGQGDVTDSHIVWRSKRGVCYVPSPLLYEGRLYVISDNGVLTVYDPSSGDVKSNVRLGGNFSASPVAAAGHIFITDERGKTHVLKPGDKPEVAAENTMESGGFASLVMSGNRIYLRTADALYCLGQ